MASTSERSKRSPVRSSRKRCSAAGRTAGPWLLWGYSGTAKYSTLSTGMVAGTVNWMLTSALSHEIRPVLSHWGSGASHDLQVYQPHDRRFHRLHLRGDGPKWVIHQDQVGRGGRCIITISFRGLYEQHFRMPGSTGQHVIS